ncbi:unnamed protein product, partial [Rotaria socialis]
ESNRMALLPSVSVSGWEIDDSDAKANNR